MSRNECRNASYQICTRRYLWTNKSTVSIASVHGLISFSTNRRLRIICTSIHNLNYRLQELTVQFHKPFNVSTDFASLKPHPLSNEKKGTLLVHNCIVSARVASIGCTVDTVHEMTKRSRKATRLDEIKRR